MDLLQYFTNTTDNFVPIGWLLIIILIAILILHIFLKAYAKKYVKEHREDILNINYQLTRSCQISGKNLSSGIPSYLEYVRLLHINDTFPCSNSIVSNASNSKTKYLIMWILCISGGLQTGHPESIKSLLANILDLRPQR